eukprot:scaffold34593_cov179-Amphora_coffeaeformis.AAC.10
MDAIDTNMNIFDSPPVAKQSAPRLPLFSSPSRHGSVFLDNDERSSTEQEEEEMNFHDDTPYEDTLREASKWIATLNITRDELFKFQIQAAMILDNFAMLAPDLDMVVQESLEEDEEMEEAELVMPNRLTKTIDTAHSQDDNDDMHDEQILA